MTQKKTPKKRSLLLGAFLSEKFTSISDRRRKFLDRRPHRTLRRTRRRDLPKHVKLPGYFSFTAYTLKTIRQYRGAFAGFLLLYVLVGTLLVGVASQENYQLLTDSFGTLGQDLLGGDIDTATQTTALFGAAITGALGDPLTEAQQTYLIILGMLSWLSVVWYLRHRIKGVSVKVRDAIYNSGAPFVSTLVVALVAAIQIVPAALGILIYSAAQSAGILNGGIEALMFATVALLLCVLSLYWVTSSFIAAIIVTIPGTYPFTALRMASDIVLGRRTSIMLRLVWLGLVLLVIWAVVLIPMILIAGWITISWLPLVPFTIQLLSAFSVIMFAAYVYLLYRKMIDEPV